MKTFYYRVVKGGKRVRCKMPTSYPIRHGKLVHKSPSRPVRIDDEVYAKITELAKEYNMTFSSPNEVLRIVTGLDRPKV